MSKRTNKFEALVDSKKRYSLKEAVSILKNSPRVKFDETVELSLNIDIDPKSSQPIRGTCALPHGTGKSVRVAVFCRGESAKKAKDAGADHVGAEDLVKKVSEGWCDFDVAIAAPDMMKDIARLGKILGPRGLMPNPKAGTVTEDVGKTVKEVKAGKIEFKMDKQGGIHLGVGKSSFSEEDICDNVRRLMEAIVGSSSQLSNLQIVKSIALSATMGPGIKLDLGEFRRKA